MRGAWNETATSFLMAIVTICVLYEYSRSQQRRARAKRLSSDPGFAPTMASPMTYSSRQISTITNEEFTSVQNEHKITTPLQLNKMSTTPITTIPVLLEVPSPDSTPTKEWAYHVSEDDPNETAIWADIAARKCSVDFTLPVSIQLAPFQKDGITQSMLDGLYCVRKHVARVSIDKDGTIRQENWQLGLDHNRLRSGMWLLQLAVRRAALLGRPIPPVEMLLNPTDKTADFASGKKKNSPEALRLRQTPLFCNAKCSGDHSISFPMYLHPLYGLPDGQMGLKRYTERRAALKSMGTTESWHEKENQMYFSATNSRGHRAEMFRIKSKHLKAVQKKVPMSHYGHYRYSVYTYGHSGWSARLREITYMNTTVFLEDSQCHEYFQHLYKPGVHFIPIFGNLSDLGPKLTKAVEDPEGSAEMASRWLTHGQDILSLECILEYIGDLLRAYARLQKFTPVPRPTWGRHYLNSTAKYFLVSTPPDLKVCSPYF